MKKRIGLLLLTLIISINIPMKVLAAESSTNSTQQGLPAISIAKDTFTANQIMVNHSGFQPSKDLEGKINTLIKSYHKETSFYAINTEDSMTVGYNADKQFSTASAIKAPYALFCYQQIQNGKLSLESTMQYTAKYKSGGTGILKTQPLGGMYSIRTLLHNALHYSDNAAYKMLVDKFGRSGYNDMLNSLGVKGLHLDNGKYWSTLSAHDLGLVWQQIYRFNDSGSGLRNDFFTNLKFANTNLIRNELKEYDVAHKGGWTDTAYHDAGIVFTAHPYILVILTQSGGNAADSKYVSSMARQLDNLMKEYNSYLSSQKS
jgi:hypothetical protein